MKFLVAILLAARTEGSHFRAINYEIIQAGNGNLQISRTMAWRRGSSGYSGGCDANHVASQVTSDPQGVETCTQTSGGSCGSWDSYYKVTDFDDSTSGDWCYGYDTQSFPAPSGPFSISWGSSAWVSFTGDDGSGASHPTYGSAYGFTATMNDVSQSLK